MRTLKTLLSSYINTDSVKEKTSLLEEIIQLCDNYISEQHSIANRYKVRYPTHDFKSGTDFWSLNSENYIDEDGIELRYERYCGNGYDERINYIFSSAEIDNFDKTKFEQDIIKKERTRIKNDLNQARSDVQKIQKELDKFEESVKKHRGS